MNKRLLSAATAVALCVLAVPASARPYDEDDWSPRRSHRHYEHRWDRSYEHDDDERDAYAERRRRHRAARQRTRTHAARKTSRRQAAQSVKARPVTAMAIPVKPQQLAAAPAPEATKPELQTFLPPTPDKPLPHRQARNDGRGCLKVTARALLERIEAQFGPMQLVSTCRPGARIAGSGRISKHASGEAVDFNAGSRKGEVVRWLIANHKNGGTMTYAGMSHIHVDVGQHFVALNSGGGGRRWR